MNMIEIVISLIIFIVIIFCMIIFDKKNMMTLRQYICLWVLFGCCICLGVNMNEYKCSIENKKVEKIDTIKQDTIYIDENVLILNIKNK